MILKKTDEIFTLRPSFANKKQGFTIDPLCFQKLKEEEGGSKQPALHFGIEFVQLISDSPLQIFALEFPIQFVSNTSLSLY